jgi:hypothetical protein
MNIIHALFKNIHDLFMMISQGSTLTFKVIIWQTLWPLTLKQYNSPMQIGDGSKTFEMGRDSTRKWGIPRKSEKLTYFGSQILTFTNIWVKRGGGPL